jgi:hypothetical protein
MLAEAKTKKALLSRFEVDALPRTDVAYRRAAETDETDTSAAAADEDVEDDNASQAARHAAGNRSVASPAPGLFDTGDEQVTTPRKPANPPPAEDSADPAD